MANKGSKLDAAVATTDSISFCRKAIFWWLPILYLLISSAFYLRTYDSAQVKISLVQMGGVCLLTLWLCRLVEEGLLAFSKDDLVCLAPFLAFMGYGIVSFIHAPYHWSSTDFFLRRMFYMAVALIVIHEFTQQAVSRLTRVLIWSAWIAVGYGAVQWFDYQFFPSGVGRGVDPFVWRGAFGDRIFSTYGNPNFFADYLVIMFPVLVAQYLKTRRLSVLVLLSLDIFDIFMAQTKGAWIGFAISIIVLLGTYFYFFQYEKLLQYRARILSVMAAILCAVLVAVAIKLRSSFTSVNFRLFTWEATWEMIMTQPLRGTGIGSFWVIYPAFRRPPIFHIEGKHNTETDHAENEYLEVLFDDGILGFGIFLWLILSTCVVAYRSMAQMTGSLKKGERAPPRAYDLLGFLVAFQGMLAHNFFDVSMRFVSSGVYLGLLSGIVVNLSRGLGLSELHSKRDANSAGEGASAQGPGFWDAAASFFLWPMRLLAWGSILYMVYWLTGLPSLPGKLPVGFNELQGPLFRLTMGGEVLQWWIAWICFAACVFGLGFVFLRIVALTRNPVVPLLILIMFFPNYGPLNLVWGFFRADVYHNIAIFFSKQQRWDDALKYYFRVGELNPAFIMSFYFKGNVFNDRFNMTKVFNPNWGDKDNVARDDFERAMDAYEEVRARAPNYVQMHHQVGVLHMKHGEWLMRAGREAEGQREWDKALERLQMYRNIDPVFAPNYYRMGQIYMIRKQYDKAAEVYQALVDAKECAVAPGFAQRAWMRKTILAYQGYVQEDAGWVHRHPYPEAYTNLGNAYFMSDNLQASEAAYKKALSLDPNYASAQRNLQALYQKAQQLGRLKVTPPLAPVPGAAQAPPSFELIPSKR